QKVLNEALNNIVEFRRQEGAKLQNDFEQQIGSIRILMDEVATYETERINAVKERLRQGLEELKVNTDQNRFEQELIYYIEKLDINEEKVRLTNHLDYFIETMKDRKSTRLNSSHVKISYAVFCLKKKN